MEYFVFSGSVYISVLLHLKIWFVYFNYTIWLLPSLIYILLNISRSVSGFKSLRYAAIPVDSEQLPQPGRRACHPSGSSSAVATCSSIRRSLLNVLSGLPCNNRYETTTTSPRAATTGVAFVRKISYGIQRKIYFMFY